MLNGVGIFTYKLTRKKLPSCVGKYASPIQHFGIPGSLPIHGHGIFLHHLVDFLWVFYMFMVYVGK